MTLNPAPSAPDAVDYLQQLQVLRTLVWLVQFLSLLLGRQWLGAAQFYVLLGFVALMVSSLV